MNDTKLVNMLQSFQQVVDVQTHLFEAKRADYVHNGSMLQVWHDDHHMVFFSEAVRHSHHIFSATGNRETLELSCNASWMACGNQVFQGKLLSTSIIHLGLSQVNRAECTFSNFVNNVENLPNLWDSFI